ncbi:MAG TPA: hypothetical protein VFS91_06390 [Nitrobacter sp.]|jgi:hypothetical protein|nr:hypothetical protein [Nitrobacter sp.]
MTAPTLKAAPKPPITIVEACQDPDIAPAMQFARSSWAPGA